GTRRSEQPGVAGLGAEDTKLEDTPEFLRLILDNIPARVFWKDLECRYLGCNAAFARDAGLGDPAAIVGKSDAELFWKNHAAEYQADDRAVLDSGRARESAIWPFVNHAGRRLWLEANKVPLRSAQGETIGLLGTFQDVTEREEKLAELKTLAAALANQTDGRPLEALTRAAAEVSGARCAFVVHTAGDLATVKASYPPGAIAPAPFNLSGTPCELTVRKDFCIYPTGVQAAFPQAAMLRQFGIDAYAGRRVTDAEGRVVGLLVIVNDEPFTNVRAIPSLLEILAAGVATELRREQHAQELAEHRQRLEVAMTSGQQGLWEWDLVTARVSTLGTTATPQVLPSSISRLWALLDAKDRVALRTALRRHLRGEHPLFEEEVKLPTASGEHRWFLLRGQIVSRDSRGKPTRLMGTHTDVTSLKDAEQAVEEGRRFLGTVLDTIPQAVYWKNENSYYLGCNQRFAE
ncbi:MAG: PAS domain-containing protein, partial [Gammaproteobacteria bacterium]